MKRIAIISLSGLLATAACKHKENAPALTGAVSAAAPLVSAPRPPAAEGAPPSFADFEGEIGLLAKGSFAEKKDPIELTVSIKGGKARIDLPASLTDARGLGPAYLLVQPAEKKAYAVLDASKQAIVFEMDKLAEQAKTLGLRGGAQPGTKRPASLQKTGTFDTVAGIKCEIWRFEQGETSGHACIAEQETSWLNLPGSSPGEPSWLSAVADGKHLPLRFVATDHDQERGRVEVTRVEHKSLAQAMFELPPGYKTASLEQMMAAMMGGLAGPGVPRGIGSPPAINSVRRVKPAAGSRDSK